jgi:hypothetical protein
MFTGQTHVFFGAIPGNDDLRLATADDGVEGLGICDAARRVSASKRQEGVEYP